MAINPNTSHPNRNTCYVACSGYGKSQALGQNPAIPKSKARVLLWDIDHDHAAVHFDDRRRYIAAVRGALASGKGFRLAWSGRCDVDTFEWWCKVVWSVLDGTVTTFVIVEELADVSPSAGKATPAFGELNRRGRKYGAQLHWTTQKSQEVSKTAFDQAATKFIGFPNEGASVDHLVICSGATRDQLFALKPLEFYMRHAGKTEKRVFKYKKPPL